MMTDGFKIQLLKYVQRNPGCTVREMREHLDLKGGGPDPYAPLNEWEEKGLIESMDSNAGAKVWFPTGSTQTSEGN